MEKAAKTASVRKTRTYKADEIVGWWTEFLSMLYCTLLQPYTCKVQVLLQLQLFDKNVLDNFDFDLNRIYSNGIENLICTSQC